MGYPFWLSQVCRARNDRDPPIGQCWRNIAITLIIRVNERYRLVTLVETGWHGGDGSQADYAISLGIGLASRTGEFFNRKGLAFKGKMLHRKLVPFARQISLGSVQASLVSQTRS